MARAKKIKEVEEVRHEEVEGQTELNFGDVPEVEEVLTGKDFPHQQKGKGGRPLSTDKKIQMKLYSTVEKKEFLERISSDYGMTSSQFIEHVLNKLHLEMTIDERNEFLGLETVSFEESQKLRKRAISRSTNAETIHHLEFNPLRKIQFSQGQFAPAEMAELFAYVNHNQFKDELRPSNEDFIKILQRAFRLDEAQKMANYIKKFIDGLAHEKAQHSFAVRENLWKIENFYCEYLSGIKINSKAKKMTVSDQNNLFKLLLAE